LDLARRLISFGGLGCPRGSYYQSNGGKGGFSRGILTLAEATSVFLFVGATGECAYGYSINVQGTFGGGGPSNTGYDTNNACSGGGGTDIRVEGVALQNRVIIAGGGGGASSFGGNWSGAAGGGENGGAGQGAHGDCYAGGGGSQTAGGASELWNSAAVGELGLGGDATWHDGGGGDGGFFGGGSGAGCVLSGGGESGFVFTKPNSNVNLDPKYFLIDAWTEAGERTGNGEIRISPAFPKLKVPTCPLFSSAHSQSFLLLFFTLSLHQ
jgi:hypothetical protein